MVEPGQIACCRGKVNLEKIVFTPNTILNFLGSQVLGTILCKKQKSPESDEDLTVSVRSFGIT